MYKRRYKKMYNNKSNDWKPRENHKDSFSQVKDKANNEGQEMSKDIAEGISQIAMKDMPKSSYAIPVDPYTELNQASEPYNLLAKYNKKFSPAYKGDRNLDSGFVAQYLTAQNTRLLNIQDCANMNIGLNYRFLPISRCSYRDTASSSATEYENTYEPGVSNIPTGITNRRGYRGSQLLRKMYDAVNEIFSQLDATTFRDLNLSKYGAISSILIPDVTSVKVFVKTKIFINGTETEKYVQCYYYQDPAAVFLLMSIEYQTILQQGLMNVKYLNKLYNNEALSLKMQYNREIAPLNQLYGQVNKTSFKALLKSIQLATQGEYIDLDWAKNNNVVTQLSSRVSDSMSDPVKEISAVYNFAPVMIFINSKPTISEWTEVTYSTISAYLIWCGCDLIYQNVNYNHRRVTVTDNDGTYSRNFREIGQEMAEETSLTYLLAWARNNTGNLQSNTIYNGYVRKVLATDHILTTMKTKFGDLRTIFDKLYPLGVVNYFKGIVPGITDTLDLRPVDYVLVDDMFKMALSGPTTMKFSPNTSRWTNYALWDKFEGIPAYDAVNGGSFLTFCLKALDCSNMETCELEYLPRLFTKNANDPFANNTITSVDRNGILYTYNRQTTTLSATRGTARLAILTDFDSYGYVAPKVSVGTGVTFSNVMKSFCELFANNVFRTYYDSDASKYTISNNVIAIYPYEIEPVESAMLSYAKAYGPLKGTTNAQATIGFSGVAGVREDSIK